MVFSSILFMFVYLPIVLAVYYIVPARFRNVWLFLVNFVFYGWGEPVYIVLMVFSITVNYVNGLLVEKYKYTDKPKAKRVLIFNIVINLALLFVFKYLDLFIGTLNSIAGRELVEPLGLVLPIGISFYTFQTMSYPIDLYRGDADVQRNYISFGTFVALFPQLIAGPIVRYKDVASQLNFRATSSEQFASGVRRFVVGLGKKVLIANNLGMLWDNYATMNPAELTVAGSWLGIIAFTLQIYFDFSGYSDMAIGLGRMLGFEFLENFNYPYISHSITEFWRRWHISLGSWFRDYVYIPLGGNRKGKLRQYFNIMVVWSLTGFWHGANWTFLMWGFFFGVMLILEKRFWLDKLEKAPKALTSLYVMFLVTLSWVLFQLDSFTHCFEYYKAMFGFSPGGLSAPSDGYFFRSFIIVLIIGAIAATPYPARLFNKLPRKVQNVAAPVLILLVLIVSTAYLVDATYNPFLYFRF